MATKETPNDLTDMQRAFVAHYVRTLNATTAARLAGYSKESAGNLGSDLLGKPGIRKAIRKALNSRAQRLEISADNVLREIARVAFADITDVTDFDADGVHVKSSKSLGRSITAAIQSIEETTTQSGSDERTRSTRKVKVRMHDKLKALDMVGRHLGMWKSFDDFMAAAKEAIARREAEKQGAEK